MYILDRLEDQVALPHLPAIFQQNDLEALGLGGVLVEEQTNLSQESVDLGR
jgi:hypothetical protein